MPFTTPIAIILKGVKPMFHPVKALLKAKQQKS